MFNPWTTNSDDKDADDDERTQANEQTKEMLAHTQLIRCEVVNSRICEQQKVIQKVFLPAPSAAAAIQLRWQFFK